MELRNVQVGTYGCFVLIAEAFVDILVHEGCFPYTEGGIRTLQATECMMNDEPTVSKNDDLEWSRILRRMYTMREGCLQTLSNTPRPIDEDYRRNEVAGQRGIHKTPIYILRRVQTRGPNEMAEPS